MEKKRIETLDLIRGLALLSMIAYHTSWDLVRIFGVAWPFFDSAGAEVWQKSICCTFILLSGFCWPLGSHPLKRGLTVFLCGALITAVTLLFMPSDPVIFGILTLIGFSMLLLIPLYPLMRKMNQSAGAAVSFVLFLIFYHLNAEVISFFGNILFVWPPVLFRGLFMTFLGFQDPHFISVDYFSVLPWSLLFITGAFLCLAWKRSGADGPLLHIRFAPVSFFGKHSLLIYMIHQPIVYGILYLIFR